MFKRDVDMRKWNSKWAGKKAGCGMAGRVDIHIFGTNYRGHRLAFLYMTGSMPDLVDHVDGNALNNAFANLRPATRGQNKINSVPSSGRKVKGAYATKEGRFVAKLRLSGSTRHLGTFTTEAEAAAAYDRAAIEAYGSYAKTNAGMGRI